MYLKEKNQYLNTIKLFDDSEDVLYLADLENRLVYYTSSLAEDYWLPPAREEGYTFEELNAYMQGKGIEAVNFESDGAYRFISVKTRMQDSRWLFGRISKVKAQDHIDEMSGLYNLKALMEDLDDRTMQDECGYLMILGIDNFKHINTQYGREYGNRVLRMVGEELQGLGKIFSKVYRLDSDKFALNLIGVKKEDVDNLYQKIREALASLCTISSGVAEYKVGEDGEIVYQHAENALYSAKTNGKNMQVFFSVEVYQKHLQFVELQEELRNCIRNGFTGFTVTYQPQIDAKTYRIAGAEALLTFNSSTRGRIGADEFIAVLEQTKLIVEVGEWVLEQALWQCKKWRAFRADFRMSVNVSYVQLKDERFLERVTEILNRVELPGKAIILEVTESMRLQDYQYFNKIFFQLSKMGIQVSIDDFGTGYSSLSYLKSLSIDEIKIDRCFVSHVQHSAYNYRLLSNIIELAHSAQIRVCCEGVETEAELTAIQKLNPDKIQGYLFARAYSVELFENTYFHPETKEFQKRLMTESYYRDLEEVDDEELYRLRQEKIASIIDGMEEMVYVRDLNDYSLYYLNAAGREATGMYDYKGKKCYEVLQGKDSPCEFCQNYHNENNDYHVWEIDSKHLNRHLLLKDKNIPWNGEIARLAVAIDVTEKEVMTKAVQEKLDFEQNIVSCTKMLLEEADADHAIDSVLQSIGEFYEADRAYLFELQSNKLFWDNTHEWCAEGVTAQIDVLQKVPIETTARWMSRFACGESIMIEDLEEIREISPEEYEILAMQDVHSLIVSPVWKNHEAIGFIGVDNPKKHCTRGEQVQTMALFIADRLQKDETKERLRELLNLHYEDILQTTQLGLWVIRFDPKTNYHEMYADKTMLEILGITEDLSPAECYEHWYSRINNGYYHYVNYGVRNMIESNRIVELSYTWNHPEKGHVPVRCLGLRIADSDGMICLEGYHREINEIDRPKYLPDHTSVILEYDAENNTAFFHNDRGLLAGEGYHEENFPDCWLEKEMIHPRFTAYFQELFANMHEKKDVDGMEFMLKTKTGSYEWFRLRIRHLVDDQEGKGTVLVLIDPTKQERALELEYMRQGEFYHAILSEKEAYAEIDIESGRIISAGGCWSNYKYESEQKEQDFVEIFLGHADEFLHPEDRESFEAFMSVEYMKDLLRAGKNIDKLEIRRLFDDEMHWAELTGHVFQDKIAGNIHALLYMKDIDAQKRQELEREMEATRDPLTGVFNRRKFEREVKKYMADRSEAGAGAFLILDMDHFKEINDRYGHTEGDTVLKHLSNVLMQTFRRRDIVGRLGGDEFVVFLRNMTNKDILNRRMEEMNLALSEYERVKVTCSVGITIVNRENFSYTRSMQEADRALYLSKAKGRNCHSYYDEL